MIDPQDMSLKYDGRVVKVEIYLNTDQEVEKLLKNLKRAARGPRLDAMVAMISQYSGEDGEKVWKILQEATVKANANPNARPF